MASPNADLQVHLLVAGVECVWAKKGKCDFKCNPFPIQALHHHMHCGLVVGELWLHNTLLVVLGLRTMQHAAELATLHVDNMQWLPDHRLLQVFVCSSKVNQAGCSFEVFVELSVAPWCPVCLYQQFLLQHSLAPGLLFHSVCG